MQDPQDPHISVILPVKDEADSLDELYQGLIQTLEPLDKSFEILFIDDGSTDRSLEIMEQLHQRDPRARVLSFIKNYGKSAALSAGFAAAKGQIIFTLDADLQDDPCEIPRFLEKLEQGYDLVTGWKKDRQDPLDRLVLTRIFNSVTGRLTGIKLHDFNCGFKCYRAEVTKRIRLYGELHRFIPALAGGLGFRIAEIDVCHHPRKYGTSRYGLERITRGPFDLLTVLFINQYSLRPLHLFGAAGLFATVLGLGCLFYLTILWFMGLGPIGTRPLFMGGIMLLLLGAQVMSLGLLGELITHVSARPEERYVIKKKLD